MKVVRLREIRKAKPLSQYELAERAQVSRATIISLETGHEALPRTIRKLAAALDVEPSVLMAESPPGSVE